MAAPEDTTEDPIAQAWAAARVVVQRRWPLIAKVAMVGVATVFAMIFASPPSYRAVAMLLVQPTISDVHITPEPDTTAVVDRTAELRITSAVALLKSAQLVREVLEANPALYESAAGDDEGFVDSKLVQYVDILGGMFGAVRALPGYLYRTIHDVPELGRIDVATGTALNRLGVRRIAGSNLIEVSYRHGNPVRAAGMVNALLDYYISEAARLPVQEDDAMQFFNEQYVLLGQRLEGSKRSLRAFHEREGAELLLESDAELRRVLGELRQSRVDTNANLAEMTGHAETLAMELAKLSPKRAQDMILERSSAVQSIKTRIVELELERNELLTRYAPTSGNILELDRQLEEARRILADETARTMNSEAVVDPTRQAVELELVKARARRTAFMARLVVLSREIEGYEVRLNRRDTLSLEKRRLGDEVTIAEQAYRIYRRKEEEARFEHALRESQILSVAVAESARVPSIPEPERKSLKLVLGLLLSLALGTVLAFILERIDRLQDPPGGFGGSDDYYDVLDDDAAGFEPPPEPATGWARATASTVATLVVLGLALGSLFLVIAARNPGTPLHDRLVSAEPLMQEPPAIAGLIVTRGRPERPGPSAAPVEVAAFAPEPEPAEMGSTYGPDHAAAGVPAAHDADLVIDVGDVEGVEAAGGAVAVSPAAEAPRALARVEPSAPVAPTSPVEPAPALHSVTVERGMTFYSLVNEVYGEYSPAHVQRIKQANPHLTDPTRITVGDVLLFPSAAQAR